jgi:GntR family transcriptional repressor for pyruvate dehydrogenase complex
MPDAPRPSRNLVAAAAETLRGYILRGGLAAGDKLPSQGKLCSELGVSRSVIREAMQILQSQGLIEISQGRRPQVLPAGPDAAVGTLSTLVERTHVSLLALLEVRRPLEVEIAGLAAQRAERQRLEPLRAAAEALANAGDLEQQIAADVRFHKALAEAAGNPLFGVLLDVLAELLRESRRHTLRASGAAMALAYHRRILAAVEASDADEARRAMGEHMEQTRRDIENG